MKLSSRFCAGIDAARSFSKSRRAQIVRVGIGFTQLVRRKPLAKLRTSGIIATRRSRFNIKVEHVLSCPRRFVQRYGRVIHLVGLNINEASASVSGHTSKLVD